jgi:CheY-like chemotaxis protein
MLPDNSTLRALVADPSPHMAELVGSMLHTLKVRSVVAIGDAGRLAAAIAARPYDLLLVDVEIARLGDFAAIRTLRQQAGHPNRHLPVIVMAAAPDAKMIAAARDAGVTEFLRKPFAPQHIALRLDALRQAPRPFVESDAYVGPDRRRRVADAPKRRAADEA